MSISISMLMLLIVIGVAAWIARRFARWIAHWRHPYGFDDYVADHPECVTGDSVRCHVCRSASIYLTRVGYTPLSILHAHICRRCGTTLYHSRSRLERPHDQDR